MAVQRIGDARVTKILETEREPESYEFVFPRGDWAVCVANRERLEPDHIDVAARAFLMSFHSYVISIDGVNILIDGCIGNDKDRSGPNVDRYFGTDRNMFHMRQTSYLQRLESAGFPPASIDYVLCTHLHCDHVGWFTHQRDGRWVPTFANARYVFAQVEYKSARAMWEADPDDPFNRSFDDSVQPVVDAGLADLVASDHQIRDGVYLEPSPGHTPGHVFINVASRGRRGIFSGDVIHNPVQLIMPNVSPIYDANDFKLARATRRGLLEAVVDTDTLLFTAHFGNSSCGRVISEGDAYWFDFA